MYYNCNGATPALHVAPPALKIVAIRYYRTRPRIKTDHSAGTYREVGGVETAAQ